MAATYVLGQIGLNGIVREHELAGGERSYNLAGKLSLCCFDVYIATTYNEREKGEKSR